MITVANCQAIDEERDSWVRGKRAPVDYRPMSGKEDSRVPLSRIECDEIEQVDKRVACTLTGSSA